MENEPSPYPVDAVELLLALNQLPTAERRKLTRASGCDETCRALSDVFDTLPADLLSKFDEEEKKIFCDRKRRRLPASREASLT